LEGWQAKPDGVVLPFRLTRKNESHAAVVAAPLSGSDNLFVANVGYRFALPYAIRRLSFGQINVTPRKRRLTSSTEGAKMF
jgi:hypothetical protein